MKKYALGVMVALVFVAYSLVLRHQHSQPVVPPTSLSNNNTSSSNDAGTAVPSSTSVAQYKDGTYTGSAENAFYGDVQVAAIIQNGKLSTIIVLQSPNDNPNSININQQALPYLKQEAIKAQSGNVSTITGATDTSQAFIQSLTTALNQAKLS